LIPHNRFPIVFLNVAIDPSLIDINIHPAKTEIRFHQEGVIKDLIYKALKYEINRYNLVPDKEISSKSIPNREVLKTFIEANKKDDEVKVNPKHYNPHIEKPSKKEKEVLLNSYKALNQKDEVIIEETQFENKVDELIYEAPKNEVTKSLVREIEKPLSRPLIRETETVISKPLVREEQVLEQVYEPPKQLFEKENETIYDHLNFVGQIFNSYLIYEKNAEMYIIDQHAAHEKILYEKFLDDYKKKNMLTQLILEPIVVEVSKMTVQNALEHTKVFQQLGYNIEAFGDDALVVREIPLGFKLPLAKAIFTDLIERLDFTLPEDKFELALDAIASRSCKAAIKANDSLMDIEVSGLTNQLKALNEPYTCPHGRPIIIKMSRGELEKKFNRT